MIQAACSQLKKDYGTEPILKDITFELNENERVALIGKNGSGKTTLLRILTGEEKADQGSVMIRKGVVIGYLKQIPVYEGDEKAGEVIRSAFQEQLELADKLRRLEEQMATVEEKQKDSLEAMLKRYDMLHVLFESRGGYEMEERLSKVCAGLKISDEFMERNFSYLSGGEKTLVCLARILLQNPDILILDEPTNHLDMTMMEWLQEYLKSYRGTVLLVSHDRYFLENAVTRILEIVDGRAEEYLGNYSYYIEEKRRRREEQEAEYKEQNKRIKEMEAAIKRMRQWAAKADNEDMYKHAKAMQKRLDKMDRIKKVREDKGFGIGFDDGNRSGKDVLRLEGVVKSYPGKVLFQDFCMEVFFQEHIALLGRNGCGKTTLIRMILGEEPVNGGTIYLGAGIKIGYLPQNIVFADENRTLLEEFRDDMVITEGKARELLSKYLFYGEEVFKKVRNLSGGEKSRLFLAKLIQKEINFLILDEPTNHLDIMSREKLEEALLSFRGTILMVSHDRYFINRIATGIVEIVDGAAEIYPGDYEYYKEEKEKRTLRKQERVQKEDQVPGIQKGEQCGNTSPETRERKKAKKNQVGEAAKSAGKKQPADSSEHGVPKQPKNSYKKEHLEQQIEELNLRLNQIERMMFEKAAEYGELIKLEKEKIDTEEQLETVMEEWLALD